MVKMKPLLIGLFSALGLLPAPVRAQEKTPAPYFIAYDHYMEEVDTLEIEADSVLGQAHDINTFLADNPFGSNGNGQSRAVGAGTGTRGGR